MTAYCFHHSQLDEALDKFCERYLAGDDLPPAQAKTLIRAFLQSPEMVKARIADKQPTTTQQSAEGCST